MESIQSFELLWVAWSVPLVPPSCFLCTSLRYSSSSWSVSSLKGLGGSGSGGTLGGLTGDWWMNRQEHKITAFKIKWRTWRGKEAKTLMFGKQKACNLPGDCLLLWRWRGLETAVLLFSCPGDSAVGSEESNTAFIILFIWYDGSEDGWQKSYLVTCLDHLSRVGEKRHKLVWVLYLNDCAASLCNFFCLLPLKERKATSEQYQRDYDV